jgi:glycosyltransferase involved in cell wall biosynthesis
MDRVIEYDVPLIMYWHGTDVMIAKQRFDSGSINNKYTVHAHHFTDAEWLQKELLEIGISTELLPFKYVEDVSEVHKYEKISVLTYLAKGKEQFYGLNEIQKLAENFPEVEFTVAGSDGKGINYPKNIQFLGWRSANEMKRLRFNHAIFIRLTEHDGNSLSVLEALASGQEVIWNYPGENCNYVQEISEIEDTFKEVIYKIELRGMISSSQNIDFVKKNHSKETILTNFKNTILRFAD